MDLTATVTTGSYVVQIRLSFDKKLSRPKGGDAQIAAEELLDEIYFFLETHPHEPDLQMLIRICDVHNVPIATNPATAKLVLMALKG